MVVSLNEKLPEYGKRYFDALTKEVIPFWLKNSIDESGAVNNCISEDGTVLSKDRYIWSQGRALWTFSAMYNHIEKKEEYLNAANGLFGYLISIGARPDGRWNYLYNEKGEVLEEDISIYVDGFVLAGMTEYYLATGNETALKTAINIYECTMEQMTNPGSYRVAPYIIPNGTKTHGVNMIFAHFYHCLAKATGRSDIADSAYSLATEVLDKFYVKDKDAILEFVTIDGKFYDSAEGRSCVPGHAIECMWFLIDIFQSRGENDKVLKCCYLIKRHLNLAWDDKKGGLILAIDIDGKEPVFWNKPDYKPWWVQLEALVATAYAYSITGDDEFIEWHKIVREYAFSHYPTPYGDWYNWLDNNGDIGESAALPVKDPFHLPRAFIHLSKLFEQISYI
ncbi:MAG: AGE family epimerase/isomerase [Clostridia bacterium]|nr:AGE family epimerase/isomerase [Clostridia bacterium]